MLIKIILFGILFFIILALLMGFTLIKSFFKIFSANKRQNPFQNQSEYNNERDSSQRQDNERKREKMYSKDDGEYIDFVEIKDDKKEDKDNNK